MPVLIDELALTAAIDYNLQQVKKLKKACPKSDVFFILFGGIILDDVLHQIKHESALCNLLSIINTKHKNTSSKALQIFYRCIDRA